MSGVTLVAEPGTSAPDRQLTWWVTALVVLTWVPVVLALDRFATPEGQRLLGVGTWLLLIALLAWEAPVVRAQVVVVVAFATLVEYTFSGWLGVYVYRLDNVPWYVPPGHGLVYLAALAIGRSGPLRRHERQAVTTTVVLGALYAAWGLSPLAPRPDVLGAFWYLCLVGFIVFGRNRLLYVGAFVVVTYLELLGTWTGAWTWQPYDPTGLVAMGNPPSGAAGGYGWFDLAAVALAPGAVRRLAALSAWAGRARRP